ncbi:Lpg1974 family pore-forming outer membrane protein [Simkania sp.]|uniref:Lpg1974 family pore-forming outer membrane protein n=1 Tax=Simkania sp. TaxID=34094 RepID=UPI003B517669
MNRKRCFQFLTLLLMPLVAWAGKPSAAEEITPSVGPIQGSGCNVIVDAEFLWWYGSVTDLSYAIKGKTIPTGNANNPAQRAVWTPSKKEEFDWSWDPGVRVGLGLVTNHDGWDVYSDWTYFYNSTTESSSAPPFDDSDLAQAGPYPIGTRAFTSTWFLTPNGEFLRRVKSKWAVLFNQIDSKLGRNFWISHNLSLQPFFGVRAYWARMHFSVQGDRPARVNATFFNTSSTYRQKSWAVGLLAGINTAWHINPNWSIFANTSVALAYGKYWVRRKSSQLEIDQNGVTLSNLSATTQEQSIKRNPLSI